MQQFKLDDEEKEFQEKIMRDFIVTKNSCRTLKHSTKESYKDMYKRLKEDSELIKKMQDEYYDLKPKDITDFFSYSKNKSLLAHTFIRTLYAQDPNRKLNQMFIKKAKRVKAWYEENNKLERVG